MPADSIGLNPEPGPIPNPTDFPIDWQDPADAGKMWFYNRSLFPDPITPLDFSLRVRSMIAGTNRANAAYLLPYRADARRINSYAYMTNLPESGPLPGGLACGADGGTRRIADAAANLQSLWETEWLPRVQARIAYWRGYDLRGAALPALADHLNEVYDQVEELWEIHFLLLIPTIVALSSFEELYEDLFEGAGPSAARLLLAGFPNKTTEAARRLWGLGREARTSPFLMDALGRGGASDVIASLCATSAGRAYWRELSDYFEQYGERDELLYLDRPSWLEDPTPVIRTLQDYLKLPDRDPTAEQPSPAARREALVAEARSRLSGYPAAVVREFEASLRAASTANVLAEDHHYWIDTRIYFFLRRIALEIGPRLARTGSLPHPQAVFFLSREEVSALATGQDSEPYRALILQRRAELERFSTVTPPPLVGTLLPLPRPRTPSSERASSSRGSPPRRLRSPMRSAVTPPREGGARAVSRCSARSPRPSVSRATTFSSWRGLPPPGPRSSPR